MPHSHAFAAIIGRHRASIVRWAGSCPAHSASGRLGGAGRPRRPSDWIRMPNTERLAQLQRIAYGAGTSDDERAAAVDELEGLRRAGARGEAEARSADMSAHDPPAAAVESAAADPDPFDGIPGLRTDGDDPERSGSDARRWAALAGAIALAVGVGIGWLFGAQTASTLAPPGTAPDDDVTFEMIEPAGAPVPIDRAPALAVFAHEQLPDDLPTFRDASIGSKSYRHLLTLPDGVTVHAALRVGGAEVCLIVEHPDSSAGATCTGDGMFPPEGVSVETSFDGGPGYRVMWSASGEVAVDAPPAG
jgi:hypothetical protein